MSETIIRRYLVALAIVSLSVFAISFDRAEPTSCRAGSVEALFTACGK